jgi:1-acyl-sn-glycerol-3-phosphate acyltransferase
VWRRVVGHARLALFACVTVFLFALNLAGRGTLRVLGRPVHAWTSRLLTLWARLMTRLLGARVEVEGTPPRAPFLLVSNHLSYMDVVVLATCLPATFVARADVASWPFLGALCRSAGTIFIDRASRRDIGRALAAIRRTLGEGNGVAFFPEATTSGGGALLPFRAPLLEVAARDALPVSYAALGYATTPGGPPASEAVCWWGGRPFLPHLVDLFSLPGFTCRIVFGDRPIEGEDRKDLARRLEESVLAILPSLPA